MSWRVLFFGLLLSALSWHAKAQFFPIGITVVSGGGSGCSQATTFIARTSGENTSALTTMICGLVADGVITGDLTSGGTKCGSALDRLYIMAMANSTDALLDLCGNASLVAHGSPTFTANAGYTGVDASSTVYLDTGVNPSTAGGNFSLNSAHFSVWSFTNAASGASGGVVIGADDSGSTDETLLYLKYSDGNSYGDINQTSGGTAIANADSTGFYVMSRSGATALTEYRNGTSIATDNTASTSAIPNETITILALHGVSGAISSGSALQLSEASLGANLTSGQVTSMQNRVCTYLTTVHGSC